METKQPETFRQWMTQRYDRGDIEDMYNHGIDGGFSGLIYTNECAALFDRYADEIWELARDTADNIGAENVEEYARQMMDEDHS